MLGRLAATGAVAAGVSAGGSGTGLASRPASPARAEQLLAEHADGVPARLEAEGVVEDRSELTPDWTALRDHLRGGGGATAITLSDGVEEVRVTETVSDGRLSVGVRPEAGHAYAMLDTGDDLLRIDEVGVASVSTQSYTCECSNEICDWPCTIEVCRDDTAGEIVDTAASADAAFGFSATGARPRGPWDQRGGRVVCDTVEVDGTENGGHIHPPDAVEMGRGGRHVRSAGVGPRKERAGATEALVPRRRLLCTSVPLRHTHCPDRGRPDRRGATATGPPR